MKRICSFTDYLMLKEGSRNSSSKTGLYPLGYGGIGLYPDADYLTHAADAVLYLTQDKRLFSNQDYGPDDITNLPGHKLYGDRVNNGENEPFAIKHIPGEIVKPQGKMPPGDVKPFSSWLKLVQKPTTISPPDSPNLPN
jgi:hypothetical protein